METKVIDTKNGQIRGKLVQLKTGESVYVYRRIPFAKPPLGDLRFMPPKPAEPWKGVIDGTEVGPRPMATSQYDKFIEPNLPFPRPPGDRAMNEDCLHLTVYSPVNRKSCTLPVMFMIYGGGFIFGSESDVDCSMLAGMNDVVVVAPNYRVSLFGFLSLGPNSPCTGNAGILDQQLALRWVRDNIEFFGGDKNNVTIFGESSGGASVQLHLISPAAEGLFHRAISQSGQATSPAFFNSEERNRNALELTLKHLKIDSTNTNQILTSLQDVPTERLIEIQGLLSQKKMQFNPMVDGTTIQKFPTQYLMDGQFAKVPYLLGHNSTECAGLQVQCLGCPSTEITEETAQASLPFHITSDGWEACKEFYGISEKINHGFAKLIASIMGDAIFVNPVANSLKFHAEVPLYVYVGNFQLKMLHDGKKLKKRPDFCTCDHIDDKFLTYGAPFYFGPQPLGVKYTDDEKLLSMGWMKYLTNFAKTGDPNKGVKVDSIWPRYQSANEILLFDHQCKIIKNFREKEVKFWNENMMKILR